MSDLIIATIRTVVPSVVGSFVLFLAARGFELDTAAVSGLEAFLIGLATATYYVIVRLLGKKQPKAEYLLGVASQPTYEEVK